MPLNEGLVFTTEASARPIQPRRDNERRGSATIDAATTAFLAAASIVDPVISGAVDTLVKAYKSANLWNKVQVIYPYVGGTALAHSLNLRDVAKYQITWTGGVTHNANGITGNGSDSSGLTGYNPFTESALNDNHLSVYCRTALSNENGLQLAAQTAGNEWGIMLKDVSGNCYPMLLGGGADYPSIVLPSTQGMFTVTRKGTTNTVFYRNEVELMDAAQVQTELINRPLRVLSTNDGTAFRFTSANLAYTTVGAKLTAAEVATQKDIVQAFQTTLGRQV